MERMGISFRVPLNIKAQDVVEKEITVAIATNCRLLIFSFIIKFDFWVSLYVEYDRTHVLNFTIHR